MTRKQILESAERAVCHSREDQYGAPEGNFGTIADLWSTYIHAATGAPVTLACKDVAAMMGLFKIARIATGVKADSFIDLAGYAACGGEIVTGGDSDEGDAYGK